MLGGRFEPYDAQVASVIEEAFQRRDAEVQATIDGRLYVIVLEPPNAMKQRLSSDPGRWRAVRRRPAPSSSALHEAAPAEAPEPAAAEVPAVPLLALVFAPSASGATAPGMRRLQDGRLAHAGIATLIDLYSGSEALIAGSL